MPRRPPLPTDRETRASNRTTLDYCNMQSGSSSRGATAAAPSTPVLTQHTYNTRTRNRTRRTLSPVIIPDSPARSPSNQMFVEDDEVVLLDSNIHCISDDESTIYPPANARRFWNGTTTRNQNGLQIEEELQPGSSAPISLETNDILYEDERKQIAEFYSKTQEILEKTSNLIKTQVKNREQINLGFCPVCLDTLDASNGQGISSTFCGHLYCTPCLVATVKSTKACPICRTELTLKKIHPIYISN